MTSIDFYFDPSCPFCWITSRWLLRVGDQRDIDVTWRPFSLAIKNNELAENGAEQSPHGAGHRAAHRVLRVIEAASMQGASRIELYSTFGRLHFIDGREYDDEVINEVLAGLGLEESLAQAADDTRLDPVLTNEMQSALDVVGNDVGVPLIVFHTEGGPLGYFGPVLNTMPDEAEALKLWDGLEQLATVTSFYELKRTRPSGGPDVASTKGL